MLQSAGARYPSKVQNNIPSHAFISVDLVVLEQSRAANSEGLEHVCFA